jgi:hypothetical protein
MSNSHHIRYLITVDSSTGATLKVERLGEAGDLTDIPIVGLTLADPTLGAALQIPQLGLVPTHPGPGSPQFPGPGRAIFPGPAPAQHPGPGTPQHPGPATQSFPMPGATAHPHSGATNPGSGEKEAGAAAPKGKPGKKA